MSQGCLLRPVPVDCRSIDAARSQSNDTITALRQIDVVGHQHERHAAFEMFGEQQINDLFACRFIEIAGWLVRHKDRRIRCKCACKRHALLLAAGQLRGIVMQTFAETDICKFFGGALGCIGAAGKFEGTATFSSAVIVGMR